MKIFINFENVMRRPMSVSYQDDNSLKIMSIIANKFTTGSVL